MLSIYEISYHKNWLKQLNVLFKKLQIKLKCGAVHIRRPRVA